MGERVRARDLQRLLDTEIFDLNGAAEYLQVKPNSVEIAAIRGRIPFVQWSHKKLFCREDLDYYARNRARGRASSLQDVAPFHLQKRNPPTC